MGSSPLSLPSVFSFSLPPPHEGVLEETKEKKGHSSPLPEAITAVERHADVKLEKDTQIHVITCSALVRAWWLRACSQHPRRHVRPGMIFYDLWI